MRRLLFFFIPIFFLFGLYYGAWELENQRKQQSLEHQNQSERHLTFLSIKDSLPPELITKFKELYHIDVKWITADSEWDLMQKSKNLKVDVILLPAAWVNDWQKEKIIKPFNKVEVPQMSKISSDFLNLPFDPDNQYSIPLLWDAYTFVSRDNQNTPFDLTSIAQQSQPSYALLPSSTNIYYLMKKNGYLDKDWEQESQQFQLKEAIHNFIGKVHLAKEDLTTEMNNPQTKWLQTFRSQVWQYESHPQKNKLNLKLLEQPQPLYMESLVLSATSEQMAESYLWIQFLVSPMANQMTSLYRKRPAVVESLNQSTTLPDYLKPNKIRELSIQTISFDVNAPAGYLWSQSPIENIY